MDLVNKLNRDERLDRKRGTKKGEQPFEELRI
jgi:hypothetical protein